MTGVEAGIGIGGQNAGWRNPEHLPNDPLLLRQIYENDRSEKAERCEEVESALDLWLANCYFASLARPKMPSGANAFEISDIQEAETEV
jgi:hypothetical protein